VDWSTAVTRRAVTLPDGLHPDSAGYEYRSKMIAKAVKSECGTTIGDVVDGASGTDAIKGDGTGGTPSPS
jgi:hypothetical protein